MSKGLPSASLSSNRCGQGNQGGSKGAVSTESSPCLAFPLTARREGKIYQPGHGSPEAAHRHVQSRTPTCCCFPGAHSPCSQCPPTHSTRLPWAAQPGLGHGACFFSSVLWMPLESLLACSSRRTGEWSRRHEDRLHGLGGDHRTVSKLPPKE